MTQDERQSSESDWPKSANLYPAVATRPAETPPGDVISMNNHPNLVGRFQLTWRHDTARYWLLPKRATARTRRSPVHNRPDDWSRYRTSRRSLSRKLTLLYCGDRALMRPPLSWPCMRPPPVLQYWSGWQPAHARPANCASLRQKRPPTGKTTRTIAELRHAKPKQKARFIEPTLRAPTKTYTGRPR